MEAAERGEAFLARLREFCESQVDAVVIERDAQIPDKVVAGLKELGAFGMKIGTEYGGIGLSQVYYNRALMLVGSVHPSLFALLSAHQSIGVPQPISMFGTEEQKRTWLPRCTQEISAFLLTEPDVGSDPARMHATAIPDGDDYVLNGVKLWTTNGVIADELVQIRGGRGYETAESLAARGERGVPAEQVLRDMRINRIFEGSTEIMHLLIAREAVDAHLAAAGDIIDPQADARRKARAVAKAGKFYARWLPTLVTGKGQLPTSFAEFGPLAGHLRYVERACRRLARSTFYAMSRWQGRLEHKQRFLARIVDIGELFAMTAACVRAQRDRADGTAVEFADAFCRQARVRAEQRFDQLWHNCDDADRTLARGVLDGRYTWLEEGVLDPSIEGPWIAQDNGAAKRDVHRVVP